MGALKFFVLHGVLATMLAVTVLQAAPGQAQACGNLLPALVLGEAGRVVPGPSNNLRTAPTTSGELIGSIPGGATFEVLTGPECNGGFAWWQVNHLGTIGWTAEFSASGNEYWLEPIVDNVLIHHPVPLPGYEDALRQISTSPGGGGGPSCTYNFDPGSVTFLDNELQIGFIVRNRVVGLGRSAIISGTAQGPENTEVEIIVSELFTWSPENRCVGTFRGDDLTRIYAAVMPPSAYFFPGDWDISLSTDEGTFTGRVRIDNGDEPMMQHSVVGAYKTYYIYNLQPNERVRILFSGSEDRSTNGFGLSELQADGDGHLAFADSYLGREVTQPFYLISETGLAVFFDASPAIVDGVVGHDANNAALRDLLFGE